MHVLSSMGLMLLAAVNLPLCDPQVPITTCVVLFVHSVLFIFVYMFPPVQVDYSAYLWAVCHLLCAGKEKRY